MEHLDFLTKYLSALARVRQNYDRPLHLYPSGTSMYRLQLQYPYQLIEEVFEMANPKKGSKPQYNRDIQFINYNMDKKQRETFNEWFIDKGTTLILLVQECIEGMYKFSLSYDPDKSVYIGALTGREDSANPYKCLVIRSADWQKALFALAWVHTQVFTGGVWTVDELDNLV